MKNPKPKCNLCNSFHTRKFYALPDYKLNRCLECGMVWDAKPSKSPGQVYRQNYYTNNNPKGGYANYCCGMRINRKTFRRRLNNLKNNFGTGKLLDVGCALGDCLIEAEKMGWKEPSGIEISRYAFQTAKEKGLNVKHGKLGDKYKRPEFDMILYQDVIEHVPNPLEELIFVYNALKPGGVVYITTPDAGGALCRLLGPYWYHYKPDEHISYFSRRTLLKALEKSGFGNIKIKPAVHIMSAGYIVNRLIYYSPRIFGALSKMLKKFRLSEVPFGLYIGNIEAIAKKPIYQKAK